MSPRAAWRLERFGFSVVHDYVGGKMDWLSFGLPHEGDAVLVGDVVEHDVIICSLDEQVGDVAKRAIDVSPAPLCIAVNDAGVVMGVVEHHALEAHPDAAVDDVLRFGVTTVRPSEELDALLERLRDRKVDAVVVTRSDGTLLGIVRGSHSGRAKRCPSDG